MWLKPGTTNYLLHDNERIEYVDGLDWSLVVDPFNPDNVTPAGYDFTLDQVEGFGYKRPSIFTDGKILPHYEVRRHFGTDGRNLYNLAQGIYMVRFLENVRIPGNMMGYMRPRSTLTRCGVTLETAVWDPGYEGISHCLMNVLNPLGVYIEHGARIGHMVLHPKTNAAGLLYTGQYQKEGL
jgi:dUTP pyrophosphatase